jgi:hypothetical protein
MITGPTSGEACREGENEVGELLVEGKEKEARSKPDNWMLLMIISNVYFATIILATFRLSDRISPVTTGSDCRVDRLRQRRECENAEGSKKSRPAVLGN